jgi:carboxyl-terminal processing protease
MTVDEVVILVRGEVGSIVRLTLRREGQAEPLVVEIQRQEIPSPSVEWRMLEEAEGVGYLRISIFSGRTDDELQDALDKLEDQGMTRLVLDLRGNGGGLLDAAIDVASQFLRDGVVAYQMEKGEKEQPFTAKRGGLQNRPWSYWWMVARPVLQRLWPVPYKIVSGPFSSARKPSGKARSSLFMI